MGILVTVVTILVLMWHPVMAEKDCSNTATGLIPLTDLGTGLYLGQQGGLYAGGSNTRPAGHTADGMTLAAQVIPRGLGGDPDPSGKIVLSSIGMSNTKHEFGQFATNATALPNLNPDLVLFNGALGGRTIEDMRDVGAQYWNILNARLELAGLSMDQVAVVWLKQTWGERPTDQFPAYIQPTALDLARIVRNIKHHMPNAVLCYVTSRIYGGYTTVLNRDEPGNYWDGFAYKAMINAQIGGDPALQWDVSPWMSWGPYMWADGLTLRGDSLTWECADFEDDGYHPAQAARDKMSAALVEFFTTDTTAVGWFLDGGQ